MEGGDDALAGSLEARLPLDKLMKAGRVVGKIDGTVAFKAMGGVIEAGCSTLSSKLSLAELLSSSLPVHSSLLWADVEATFAGLGEESSCGWTSGSTLGGSAKESPLSSGVSTNSEIPKSSSGERTLWAQASGAGFKVSVFGVPQFFHETHEKPFLKTTRRVQSNHPSRAHDRQILFPPGFSPE